MRKKIEMLNATEFRNEYEVQKLLAEVLIDIRDQFVLLNDVLSSVTQSPYGDLHGAVRVKEIL